MSGGEERSGIYWRLGRSEAGLMLLMVVVKGSVGPGGLKGDRKTRRVDALCT